MFVYIFIINNIYLLVVNYCVTALTFLNFNSVISLPVNSIQYPVVICQLNSNSNSCFEES